MTILLTACGGGGGSNNDTTPVTAATTTLSGGGVKGPLANADVAFYSFDPAYVDFQSATPAATGTTDDKAGFSVKFNDADLDPPYILVFTANGGTVDLMTGQAPILSTMKTVVTQEMLDSGVNIYATPLTSMAVDVAIENALANRAPYSSDAAYQAAATVEERFLASLPIAARQVKSTLGFGLDAQIDIYNTPPLLDDSTDTTAEQADTARYRAAVEAFGAVVEELKQQVNGTVASVDVDTMVQALTADLADGSIDGIDADGNSITVLPVAVRDTIEAMDPESVIVPGTSFTVAEIEQQLADETQKTGATTDTTALTDGTIAVQAAPARVNPDLDGDGVLNADDAFPLDATESKDSDGDGIGDNADPDADGDGILDEDDFAPLDPAVSVDPSLGTSNDADGDGVDDASDNCSVYNPRQTDTDGDSQGDACDDDDDGDGVLDANDAFPMDAGESVDSDGDGIGNQADTDDDNDGVPDTAEAAGCELLVDCDGDGRIDSKDDFPADAARDRDTDGDGLADVVFALVNGARVDADGDGKFDLDATAVAGTDVDDDDDGDGTADASDAYPLDPNRQAAGTDADGDGFEDGVDNCPSLANPLQRDRDGDSAGDVCDDDDDGDGVLDANDAFPLDPARDTDTDGDGLADEVYVISGGVRVDADGDGNADIDANGIGDSDDDNDGVADSNDAFPLDASESVDSDGDGVGDNSDAFPNDATETVDSDGDGVGDNADAFPNDATETADSDGDTVGDNADNCPNVANADQADSDGNGVGDACEAGGGTATIDATGVWKTTSTVTSLTELNGAGSCSNNDPVNTVNKFYMTMAQSGTGTSATLTAKTVWGDALSGTIDDSTGAFSLSGITTWTDPFTGDVEKETISVNGTASGTSWTGTVSITFAFTPSGGTSIDECTETDDLAGSFVYKHTGSEDYSGVYGIEAGGDNGRESFVLEFSTSGSTLNVDFLSDGTETVTVNSYDPNTGFFSVKVDSTEDFDDGSGSETWTDNVTGIFVRAPGDTSGPQVSMADRGYGQTWDGLGGTGTVTGTDYEETESYGQQRPIKAYNRSVHYRPSGGGGDRDDVALGLLNPPLKGNNARQYLEVLDTDGVTQLCTGTFDTRYSEYHYEPAADMATEQFPTGAFSAVSAIHCLATANGATVIDGGTYTVRLRDMGGDGVIGGTDDTTLFSTTHTAVLHPTPFTDRASTNAFVINGAAAPKTMKRGDMDGVINQYGFIDVSEALSFAWTGLADADSHQVQIQRMGDYEQTRLNVTAPAATVTIPANVLDGWDPSLIRVRANKTDAGNGGIAFANSKWLLVNPGIKGLFNVELGTVLPMQYWGFLIYLDGGMDGLIRDCHVYRSDALACVNVDSFDHSNPGGYIDYATNTVHVVMEDLDGTLTGAQGTRFALDFAFSDSANATVTSTDVAVLDAANASKTHVRMVTPEMNMRSLRVSNGNQQTYVAVRNLMGIGTGDPFDQGDLRVEDNSNFILAGSDTGLNVLSMWNNNVLGEAYETNAGFYLRLPTDDGMSQLVGHYLRKRTRTDWGLGWGLLDGAAGAGLRYELVVSSSNLPGLKWVFKQDYTAPDASALVAPVLSGVTVELPTPVTAATGTGDSGNPIDVSSQPAFGLTWTGSTVTGGLWQVSVTDIVTGQQFRTSWMDASHADITDNGDGTWTWTNPGITVNPGQTVVVQITTRDPANTMLGSQRGADRVYLTVP